MKKNNIGLDLTKTPWWRRRQEAWEQNGEKEKDDALLTEGQLERRPVRPTLHWSRPSWEGEKDFFFFDKLKFHYQCQSQNGIAVMMFGWHYLRFLDVLYLFSEDGGPSGEKLRRFSLATLVSRQLRGANSCSGASMYKQTNRLYVQGHLKSHIHMNNAT